MRKEVESSLLALPAKNWKAKQVVVFDWYDGPREGICELEVPKVCFSFELLAERTTKDDLDDRIFRLSILPSDAVQRAIGVLNVIGEPANSVWVPLWKFPSEASRVRVEDEINRILDAKKRTDVIVWSRNMLEFLGCWKIQTSQMPVDDLFAHLEI